MLWTAHPSPPTEASSNSHPLLTIRIPHPSHSHPQAKHSYPYAPHNSSPSSSTYTPSSSHETISNPHPILIHNKLWTIPPSSSHETSRTLTPSSTWNKLNTHLLLLYHSLHSFSLSASSDLSTILRFHYRTASGHLYRNRNTSILQPLAERKSLAKNSNSSCLQPYMEMWTKS